MYYPPFEQYEEGNTKKTMEKEKEPPVHYEFPIQVSDDQAPMKNINLVSLSNFHGLVLEDPNPFIFEFTGVFRTYDYLYDSNKLKLFPSTLKDASLRWSMIL